MSCPPSWKYNLTCRSRWNRLQTTNLHPALSCAAASILLQLYLYPAVHISFSRSLFQVFRGRPLPMWPCGVHSSTCFVMLSSFLLNVCLCIWCSSAALAPDRFFSYNSLLAILSGQCILRKCTVYIESTTSHKKDAYLIEEQYCQISSQSDLRFEMTEAYTQCIYIFGNGSPPKNNHNNMSSDMLTVPNQKNNKMIIHWVGAEHEMLTLWTGWEDFRLQRLNVNLRWATITRPPLPY